LTAKKGGSLHYRLYYTYNLWYYVHEGRPEYMHIDTNSIVTATEANQNFSRVAKLAEKRGRVVVFKNNRPKLLIIDLDTEPQIDMSEDERLEFVARRILKEHRAAFEELAK
jgi:antitoxin Phd